MSDASLLTMFDEVRGKTLRLLDGVTEQAARWTPAGTHNPILWHAGHALVIEEWIVQQVLQTAATPAVDLPEGWPALFNWASRPEETPPDAWPTLAAVVEQLRQQQVRLREQLAAMTEPELARTMDLPGAGGHGKVARRQIVHAIHDEANHQGELWLLRKLHAAQHPAAS